MRIVNTMVEGNRVVIEIADGENTEVADNSILLSLQTEWADEDSLALIKYRALKAAQAVLSPLIQETKRTADLTMN